MIMKHSLDVLCAGWIKRKTPSRGRVTDADPRLLYRVISRIDALRGGIKDVLSFQYNGRTYGSLYDPFS
jgi:hypothetical protein